MSGGPDRHSQRMRASARGKGQVHQAGGDMSFPGTHHHQHDYDIDPTGIQALFLGKGPGRVLILFGLLVVMFGVAGGVSVVFGVGNGMEPGNLPSGVSVAVVYILGTGVGSILMAIGASMAKAGARGANRIGHLAVTVLVIAGSLFGLDQVLAGAPVSTLTPSFSTSTDSTPAVVVSNKKRTVTRGKVTMTVTGIENRGKAGMVHLRVTNHTGATLTLASDDFLLTDARGATYEGVHSFGGPWEEDIGSGATRVGTITLTRPVKLGRGPLRAEFTVVYGFDAVIYSIAVTGIPSR